ncbi:MAG: GH25 family lysozyme [Negativicutes bacterium]|nr:GH25 family lysozyme [Negativicutes bacterium]
MKGIDISAWQDNIDWQAVKAANVEFVIIKLGQADHLDNLFAEHVNNAVAYGLKFGIYLYSLAKSREEAETEADWAAEQVRTYLNGIGPEMGIWFDVEDDSIAQDGADITGLCAAFVNRMRANGFQYVGVYSSYNWLTNGYIRTEELENVPFWCAQYNRECNFENQNLRIWQYTDSLNIAGSNFDGNIYFD